MTEHVIILRCSGIQKFYSLGQKAGFPRAGGRDREESPAQLHVLKGIDLEVREGEVISIVGASGSGKSTLLHILGGLDRPSAGSVFWQDKDISLLDDEPLAVLRGTHVGFVFQFHYLLPEFTALENVMIPQMIQRKSVASSREKAIELLDKVGLGSRLHHKPTELSGGEQQRVAVARALANRPRIVFADEPSGNLDSSNSRQLHALFQELNELFKQTFLIVTHNEEFAEHSHRQFRMVDGKLQR
ncbi:MAG: ABC transporter ATP-binding protein [Bacteroidota bacterium]|jgi:lipoprotein-releasing system ATP-binding protein